MNSAYVLKLSARTEMRAHEREAFIFKLAVAIVSERR